MSEKGAALLALQHKGFDYKEAFKVFNGIDKPWLAFLWGTFGTEETGIITYLNRYPRGTLEIYLSNEVGRRNLNFRAGEMLKTYSKERYQRALIKEKAGVKKAIQARILKIRELIETHYIEHRFILTLGLEDNFNNETAIENLIEIVREVWPYEVARNPLDEHQNKRVFGTQRVDFLEFHTDTPRAGAGVIWTNDGRDLDYGQSPILSRRIDLLTTREHLKRLKKEPGVRLLWESRHQGLDKDSKIARPPRKRRPHIEPAGIKIFNEILKGA